MIFHESEKEFDRLDWKQFEELCYDIQVKFNFHTMFWRHGGIDNGRDIEAKQYRTDSIVSPYEEKWIIECRRYSNGLSLDQTVEKVNWARVEKSDHFLHIVSLYITTIAREWLIKSQHTESFKTRIIEGKVLKHRLLLFPDLINKYVEDDHIRFVRSLMR